MLRTLKNLFKQDREKFVVPKSVQNVIPIKTIWEDGIFLVGRNKYAKTFKFEDINYAVARREDKEAMFLEYSELLNSLDSGATTKITINNRRLNRIRMCIWKQWKKPKTKARNLIKMGVPEDLAMQAGNTRRGHWFATHTVAVNMAMTKERLINSGFYDLATAYQSVHVNF